MRWPRIAAWVAIVAWGGLAVESRADEIVADGIDVDQVFPESEELTGRDIYERFIQQRFHESFQKLRSISRDPGGSAQTSHFTVSIRDHRDENDQPTGGIIAKTLVEVLAPYDVRHTRYLMIAKDPGPDDEFIFRPSARIVRRVDLKNTSLLGTDYTFNDIAFQKIEDADYIRKPDEVIEGVPVFVVEALAKGEHDVAYRRTLIYLEQEHYVPLRLRYWDDYDVEIKVLTSPHASIRAFDDVWVATESTMHDLRQDTTSTLFIDDLDVSPDFHAKIFSANYLSRGR